MTTEEKVNPKWEDENLKCFNSYGRSMKSF